MCPKIITSHNLFQKIIIITPKDNIHRAHVCYIDTFQCLGGLASVSYQRNDVILLQKLSGNFTSINTYLISRLRGSLSHQ
jgi:hypothetical protein